MTLNYNLHGREIEAAYRNAAESADGDKWVIFDYEGNSNTLRVGEEGTGGLEEFASSFSSGKLQFGVIAVKLSSDVLSKVVLIHWQGEGVPTLRLASTTSHAEEFKRFLKSIHIVLHARSEIDIEPDAIRKEVRKLPSTNTSSNAESSYSVPDKVESVYKPTKPHVDLSSSARDEFWNKMNSEEKSRVAEERKAREAAQKQYEEDRKRTAKELETKAESFQQPDRVTSVYKPTKPHVELKPSEREQFWNKMNEEEKRRVAEEKAVREAQLKQYDEDRKRMAKELESQAESQKHDDRVTSVYKPTKPHVEINTSAREDFWNKMNEEEKRRVEEEKAAAQAKQKVFEEDRKRIADDLHAQMSIQQENHVTRKVENSAAKEPVVVGGVVGRNKELFNNKPVENSTVVRRASNGGTVKKWPPVATNREADVVVRNEEVVEEPKHNYVPEVMKPPAPIPQVVEEPKHTYLPEVLKPAPVPSYDAYEEPPAEPAPTLPPPEPARNVPQHISSQYDLPPAYVPQPAAPPAAAPSHLSSMYDAPPVMEDEPEERFSYVSKGENAPPPMHISSQYDMPPVISDEWEDDVEKKPLNNRAPIDQYDFPPASGNEGNRAMALWDYQAADDTEISFDPDDIITEIDQVDPGWWKGKAPSGRVGLFPANYVKLL